MTDKQPSVDLKGPPCSCGSMAVIDRSRHADYCTRGLWADARDLEIERDRLLESKAALVRKVKQLEDRVAVLYRENEALRNG